MVYFMTKRWKNEKSRDNMRANRVTIEIKKRIGYENVEIFSEGVGSVLDDIENPFI